MPTERPPPPLVCIRCDVTTLLTISNLCRGWYFESAVGDGGRPSCATSGEIPSLATHNGQVAVVMAAVMMRKAIETIKESKP